MSHSGDLLRLLMPAVSPVPTRDAPRPQAQPIESRSFDSLLDEARLTESQTPANAGTDETTDTRTTEHNAQPVTPNTLSGLTGISAIQNASLRQIVSDGANG